jgi:hypothetical protein
MEMAQLGELLTVRIQLDAIAKLTKQMNPERSDQA